MYRKLLIAVSAVSLALGAVGPVAGQTDTSSCQSCYTWTNDTRNYPWLWPIDSQCCYLDTDCPLQGTVQGYFLSACWVTVIPLGYGCGGTANNSCLRPDKPCTTAGCKELCPVLIDLDSNGFHLAGFDGAVRFDLAATGVPQYYSWTNAGSRDAFLCYDRDGSGHIESGRELFGNRTLLLDGATASNGYEALRELDLVSQGGNADGKLTTEDAKFKELCVWIDEDHDGMSDPGEILTLAQAGVVEISYEYHESRRLDIHGNEFRYQSTAKLQNPQGHPRSTTTYDVFFVTSSND